MHLKHSRFSHDESVHLQFKYLRRIVTSFNILRVGLLFATHYSHAITSTHLRLNELSLHYIIEESNFNFRYVRLCNLDIPEKNG